MRSLISKERHLGNIILGCSHLFLAAILMLAGCGQAVDGTIDTSNQSAAHKPISGQQVKENEREDSETAELKSVALNSDDIFSDRDFETDYDKSKSTVITLNGSSAESSSDAVEIEGSTVTIKDEGTYVLTGTLDDGMIIVDSDKEDKTQLVLNGVNIHSKTCAPIYILQSDKVFITLVENTENILSNGGSFIAMDDNNIDAVIFSKEDLTLNGGGFLTVNSPVGHGIVSKDELVFTGGAYDITSGLHGISGKDCVAVAGGSYHITSGKDGIHGENDDDNTLGYVYLQGGEINIMSEDDGISAAARLQVEGGTINIASEDDAFHADETLAINGGTINISESYEGLEGLYVEISGGNIALAAEDDGINAAGGMDSSGFGGKGGNDMFGGRGGQPDGMGGGKPDDKPVGGMPGSRSSTGSVTISGGEIYVKASGDGIDANGSLTISGGNIVICGPNHGDTATLDYDTTAVITGGTFVGSGAMGMAQTFRDSEQGVVSVNVGGTAAGTEVTLADKSGNILLAAIPEMDFSVVILISPDIVSGETYTLTVGVHTADFVAE